MGSMLDKQTVVDESVSIFVDSTVSRYKVTVFSKTFCPYCRKAKQILSSYPIKEDCLEIIELEKRPDMSQIQAYLKQITGASTVPRIFINSNKIGGCDDLTKLHKNGELKRFLEECDCLNQ